jgi:RNA ligase (TIGR02306 family)
MSERKLASIRTITDIRPIENADMIELASVGGWNVVVAKNVGHKVGDWVVYCEIDSFLPIREEFEFLRKSSYKKMGDREGFRLKTVKLRGQISQGLILPFHILPFGDTFHEGQDVSDILGIIKYEPPIPAELAGKVKGVFPSFIPKTDEERVQNIAVEYTALCFNSNHKFYVTEKLDGSSATYYIKNGEFGVCSRNLELLETEDNTFWKVARHLGLEEKMSSLGRNISFQGELIGEGIQGNPYKIKGQTVKFFNIFDIDTQSKVGIYEFVQIIEELGLETVPILYDFVLPESVEKMLEIAEGKSQLNSNTEREGLVVRSYDMSISFKAISNKFLLKNEG